MLLKAFSIYDRKTLQYHPPFFSSTDRAAVRSFGDLCNDVSTTVGAHPNDYVLYLVGEYDDQKGALIPCVPLHHVADGQALVKPVESPLFNAK